MGFINGLFERCFELFCPLYTSIYHARGTLASDLNMPRRFIPPVLKEIWANLHHMVCWALICCVKAAELL